MQIFLSATEVKLTIPLQDESGNALAPTGVSYRVIDQDGVEKVPSTVVVDYALGNTEVEVTVPASINATLAPRELRVVEVQLSMSGNIVMLTEHYIVQAAEPLVPGVNSYQTLARALLNAASVATMSGWAAASTNERISALIEARDHINQLSFRVLGNGIGQDHIGYSFESTEITVGDLRFLTEEQFNRLPERFKRALELAQVVEADAILGGDITADKRKSGLMAETIGESKLMFQAGKPLDIPVCKRALGYLKPYVSFKLRAGR